MDIEFCIDKGPLFKFLSALAEYLSAFGSDLNDFVLSAFDLPLFALFGMRGRMVVVEPSVVTGVVALLVVTIGSVASIVVVASVLVVSPVFSVVVICEVVVVSVFVGAAVVVVAMLVDVLVVGIAGQKAGSA